MSDIKVTIRGKEQLLLLPRSMQTSFINALNDTLVDLYKNLQDEVPVANGDLRNSMAITPVTNLGNKIQGRITIGNDDVQYAVSVQYGVDKSLGIVHQGHPYMVFDEWENGPDELRWNDGLYHFRRVNHWQPANDFIGRAIRKTDINRKIMSRITFRKDGTIRRR